ncbi:16S rRNA (uracil(1498)-N(3))-methyltransferase [Tumebacillus flagellatus]|uniref:Ribosomal RNA small subunit methyltransferase E n=1 Tax=Tumebacillus flagellatus TaxID=1157490 RepID=A0A074LRQ1_9BACL|nr:16S rRNA (uracil(1498)-N(3))-methyltransferase [Tumebacillus flagellatus]KEO83794.1 16S rRNA methyltransferase [Tumebacillus flagellatus]
MQRYFVQPDAIADGRVTITGDDVKHIVRVMRMEAGEEVIVCDGLGRAFRVELTDLGDSSVEANIVEELAQSPEPAVKITLAQGLPKGDKMELIVQKGTEVGIARFLPVDMARCVVQYDAKKEAKRRERWQKIAKEAAEQAHRNLIPSIGEPMSFKQVMSSLDGFDLVVVPYEGEKARSLREVLADAPDARHICVLIGPEGGIADAEIETALSKGALPVTLGPRILRTETAGLVAATCIYYHYGEMGG